MSKISPPPIKQAPRWARNGTVAKYFNVSDMTVWRWQRDANLNFPKPTVINKVSYTDLNLINRWMRARSRPHEGHPRKEAKRCVTQTKRASNRVFAPETRTR